MISRSSSGSFQKTRKFLEFVRANDLFLLLDSFGRQGVDLLSSATPVDTGETAHSWYYRVSHTKTTHTLSWFNSHDVDGVNIAVILQYGHGTGTGGYVEGIDYINPVIRPLFDQIVDDIWRQVSNA